ncbi:MAG: hypothetical protein ACREA0_10175 [bacterium]
MKILHETPFINPLCPGDVIRLKHQGETIPEQPITVTLRCAHAAVIELDGELGLRAIGGAARIKLQEGSDGS